MSSNVDALKQTVLKAVKSGPLSGLIEDIAVEPEIDDDGTEFLRVQVQMKSDEADDADLESLLEKIETALLEVDDRYPSVRFLDAA